MSRLELKSSVLRMDVRDHAVLLDRDSGACVELDASGRIVLDLLLAGMTPSEVAAAIAEAAGVDLAQTSDDVLRSVEQMMDAGLLCPR